MSDVFGFTDKHETIPSEAVQADPAQAMRDLMGRVAELEQQLDEARSEIARLHQEIEAERSKAVEDRCMMLGDILCVYDQVSEIVERHGVTTNAQEAGIIRRMVAFGRLLRQGLARHEVTAIDTIGKPHDPETSEVAGTVGGSTAPAGTVVREQVVGYRWPAGVIRKAQVVVSDPDRPPSENAGNATATDATTISAPDTE